MFTNGQLFDGRMFAYGIQNAAHIHQAFSIQLQGFYRRSANSGESGEAQVIFTPRKMFSPLLLARMKKRNHLSRDRIERRGSGGFVTVAALTTLGTTLRQILRGRWAASILRDDVIYGGSLWRIASGIAAILTIIAGPFDHQTPQGGRDILFSHGRGTVGRVAV